MLPYVLKAYIYSLMCRDDYMLAHTEPELGSKRCSCDLTLPRG